MGILRTPMTQDRAGISSLRRRAACPSRPAAPVCPLVRQPCPRNRPADAVCRRFAAPSILRRCRRRCVRRYRSGRRRMYQPYVAYAAIRARKRRTVPYRSPYQPQCLEGDDGDDVCHGQAQQDGSRRDFRAELPSHFGDRCKTWRVGEREQQEGDGRRLAVAVR